MKMHFRDVDAFNFCSTNEPPSGEIYVKGNSVFKGYFKNLKMTKEVIDKDGWLKVGDIGILNANGSIKIVERVKEMTKL